MVGKSVTIVTRLVIFSVGLSILGCTEAMNPFAPLDSTGGIDLETLTAGQIVAPFEEIPVTVRVSSGVAEEDAPTGGIARITSIGGEVVAEQVLGAVGVSSSDTRNLVVPENAPPIVELIVQVDGVGSVLLEERRQLFVTNDPLSVADLVIYPPVAETSSQILATIDIDTGESLRPYLRWYFDGTLRAEGYWEEDFSVAFETPRDEGVYGLRVDVFPFGPEEGVRLHGTNAPVTFRSELYVVWIREPAPGELEPTDETVALYHLAGNLRNSVSAVYEESGSQQQGRGTNAFNLEPIGQPMLMIQDDVFGYYLGGPDPDLAQEPEPIEDSDESVNGTDEEPGVEAAATGSESEFSGRPPSGVVAPISIIPPTGETVQVELQFMPFAPEASARLLQSRSTFGEVLSLHWQDGVTLDVAYNDGLAESSASVPLIPVFGKTDMTIVVSRSDGRLGFSFFQENVPLGMIEMPSEPGEIESEEPETVVSGTGGMIGIFDELAFSLADGTHFLRRQSELVMANLEEQYGSSLVSADLFLSVEQDSSWSTPAVDLLPEGLQVRLSSLESLADQPVRVTVSSDLGGHTIVDAGEYIRVSNEYGLIELDNSQKASMYRSDFSLVPHEAGLVLSIQELPELVLADNQAPSLLGEAQEQTAVDQEVPGETSLPEAITFSVEPAGPYSLQLSQALVLRDHFRR